MMLFNLLTFYFYKYVLVLQQKNNTEDFSNWAYIQKKVSKTAIDDPTIAPPMLNVRWPTHNWIDLVKSGKDMPLSDFSWFEILTDFNLFTHSIIQYWCFISEVSILLLLLTIILVREWDFKFLFKFVLVFFNLLIILNIFTFLKFPTYVHFFFNDLCFNDNYIFIIKLIILLLFQFFLLILYHRFFDRQVNNLTAADKLHYKIVLSLFLSFLFLSLALVSINDFFGFYIILEGLSFGLVFSCLLNFNKTFHVLTSIRYFVYNLFVSGGLLLGIAFLYGLLGTTSYFNCKMLLSNSHIEIAAIDHYSSLTPIIKTLPLWESKSLIAFVTLFFFGCFFKLGCFPFNTWILTVNQMISYEVFFLFNIIFKNVFFFVFFRICTYYLAPIAFYWSPILLFFGYCSIFVGTLGAFGQKRIKSFLTFSSVVQVGYSLIGMSLTNFHSFASVFFLHFIYMFSNIIIVGCLLYLSCTSHNLRSSRFKVRSVFYVLSDLQLLRQISPLLAIVITIAFLSMAGLPPTLGFFAKYYFYEVLFENGLVELFFVLLLLNGLSLYYYINILKNIWLSTDSNAVNTVVIPWFNHEFFMVITTGLFCLLNILAIFIHKHILFLASKLSFIASYAVFAQVYMFIMKFQILRYLYTKSIYLSTEPHVSAFLAKFSNDVWSQNPNIVEFMYRNKGVEATASSFFEREMILDRIVRRNIFQSWQAEFENFSGPEWTAYSTTTFVIFQSALVIFIILIVWSFFIIYIKKFDRFFLSHPELNTWAGTFKSIKDLLTHPDYVVPAGVLLAIAIILTEFLRLV